MGSPPPPPPPETTEQARRRLDRKLEQDKVAMLRISLDLFEERFDLGSHMAHHILRGEPVPDDRIRGYVTIAPDKSVADYHEGRRRIRARLLGQRAVVDEWMDQYETWLELSRERYAASVRPRVGAGASGGTPGREAAADAS